MTLGKLIAALETTQDEKEYAELGILFTTLLGEGDLPPKDDARLRLLFKRLVDREGDLFAFLAKLPPRAKDAILAEIREQEYLKQDGANRHAD